MNKTILLFGIVILGCIGLLLITPWVRKESSPPPIEQQDTTGLNPFTVATRVELLTYDNRMEWWYDIADENTPLLENGRLHIPHERILSQTTLKTAILKDVQDALYAPEYCKDPVIAFCYQPRHMLLFYNAENTPFGYIEFCISCGGGRLSEGFREIQFCIPRMEYLGRLLHES